MNTPEKSVSTATKQAVTPRRRWPRRLAILFAVVAGLVAFAPQLVCRPLLRDAFLRRIVPPSSGQIQVEQLKFGWLSPIEARGVIFRSHDMTVVAASARCDRRLVDLLRDPTRLGSIEVHAPEITLARHARAAASRQPIPQPTSMTPAASDRDSPAITTDLSVRFRATRGVLNVVGPDGGSECLARDIECELTAAPSADHAEFRVNARPGGPAGTAHVAAHGTIVWPFDGTPQHVKNAQIELFGVDPKLIEHVLSQFPSPNGRGTATPPWAPLEIAGVLCGTADLRPTADSLACRANLEIKDLSVTDPVSNCAIHERSVLLHAACVMTRDTVLVDSLRVNSQTIAADATGKVTDLHGRIFADLAGSITCDWRRMEPLVQRASGAAIRVSGKASRPWRWCGPLAGRAPAALFAADAKLATFCDALHIRGFDVGPLDLVGHWQNETCRVEPVSVPFQGGQLAVEPTVRIRNGEPILSIARGRVIDRVDLTPQLCDGLLRYVDPLFTVSGNLSGKLSLEVDEFEIPLNAAGLEHGTLTGQLILDGVEFVPDRALADVLTLAGLSAPTAVRTSQTVSIRLADGRVHHAGLVVPLGQEEVTLDGWVGLDHSLSVRVSVPVTEKLVGRDKRIYRLLRGQRIELPVTGTLERPHISNDAVKHGVQRLIQTALSDHLEGDDLLRSLLRRALR
jgi:hypothetical protein